MSEDPSFLDLVGDKSFTADTTNLPQAWSEFQDSLWETLTFQRNIDYPRRMNAVGLSLALQCSDRKAQDVATSEMQLWRRNGRGWRLVEPREHWFARMLSRRPNEFHTWDEFWRMVVIHFDFAQQAMIFKDMDRQGNVTGLIPLPTGMARPRVSPNGNLFYEIAASTEFDRSMIGANTVTVPAYRIIHIKGRMYDGLQGLSNAQLGDGLFGLLDAIANFQRNLFGNDGRQPIVFESDSAGFGEGAQADAAFRRLKDQLTERVRKMNQYGDPILLEAGYKAKVIAQNAREAMTNEAYEGLVMRVCGLMKMMPHKIYAYQGVKYDNQATANNAYYNEVLRPVTSAIEKRLHIDLLDEDEWYDYSVEFDQMPLMAGDPQTMVEILDQALKSGAIEIDEFRERVPLGLNPLPNDAGQVRYVPVNMAIVDRAGNVVQAAQGQNEGVGQDDDDAQPGPRLAVDNT